MQGAAAEADVPVSCGPDPAHDAPEQASPPEALRVLIVDGQPSDTPDGRAARQAESALVHLGGEATIVPQHLPALDRDLQQFPMFVLADCAMTPLVERVVSFAEANGRTLVYQASEAMLAEVTRPAPSNIVPFQRATPRGLLADACHLFTRVDHFIGPASFLAEIARSAVRRSSAFAVPSQPSEGLLDEAARAAEGGSAAKVNAFIFSDSLGREPPGLAAVLENCLRRHTGFRLHIVGDDKPNWLRGVATVGGNRFVRHPPAGPAERDARLAEWLRAAQLVLVPLDPSDPSIHGFGERLFLEAGAFGVPLVATATRGLADCIRHGETGFLCVSPDDWGTLLDVLVEDGGLRESVSRAVRAYVGWEIREDRAGEALVAAFREICDAEPRLKRLVRGRERGGFLPSIRHGRRGPRHLARLRAAISDAALPALDVVVNAGPDHRIEALLASLAESYPPDRLRVLIDDRTAGGAARLHAATQASRDRFRAVGVSSGEPGARTGEPAASWLLLLDGGLAPERGSLRILVETALAEDAEIAAFEMRRKPFEDARFYDPVSMRATWASGMATLLRPSAWAALRRGGGRSAFPGPEADLPFRAGGFAHRVRYVPDAVAWSGGEAVGSPTPAQAGLLPPEDAPQEVAREGASLRLAAIADAPLVSAIVRVHGPRAGLLLQEALGSLMNQTYRAVEVIVVEDCGVFSRPVCEAAAEAGLNVRHVCNEAGGRNRSGNLGLGMAAGEFLTFLDFDDLVMPDHIEVLAARLIADPEAAAAVGRSWSVCTNYVRQANGPTTYVEQFYERFMPELVEIDHAGMLQTNLAPIQAVLFRRSLYEELGGLDESLPGFEDWDLWIRYCRDRQFSLVDKQTSIFRVRDISLHNADKAKRQQLAHRTILRKCAGPAASAS